MTIVQIGNKLFPFPEQWNDLTGRQLLRVMDIFCNHGDTTIAVANTRFFKILSNCSWLRLCMFPLDVQENVHLVEWLYEDQPEKLLTRSVIPYYRGMYGPADEMGNLCAAEFFWAQHFFDAWASDKAESNLNKLVATLYRPEKLNYNKKLNPDGDVRESYNANLTEVYEKLVAKWPNKIKHAIAKWFEHCFLSIRRKYPEPFIGGGGQADFGFFGLLRGIAERGIHGNFEKVELMNIHTFFIELSITLKADRQLN